MRAASAKQAEKDGYVKSEAQAAWRLKRGSGRSAAKSLFRDSPPYYAPVWLGGWGVREGGLGGGEAAFRRGFNRQRFYVKGEAQAEQLVLAPRLAQLVKRLFGLINSGT